MCFQNSKIEIIALSQLQTNHVFLGYLVDLIKS